MRSVLRFINFSSSTLSPVLALLQINSTAPAVAKRAPSASAANLSQATLGWVSLNLQGGGGKPAVGSGDDVLAADDLGEPHDPLGDQFGVLHQVGGVTDDARNEDLARRAA